nr:3275_t:CDS:1 [Entrophospora candida]CAG8541835.1 10077_t:CDS:1 [Entrophospora candida]
MSIYNYKPRDLLIEDDIIYCRPHHLETCSTCDLNLAPLNSLHKSLLAIKGNIPPPNAVDQYVSKQITGFKDEGNKLYNAQSYNDAIKHYTTAIELAFQRPFWEPHEIAEQDLAICLSNRAAAYIGLEDWVSAYVDAEFSNRIKENYPKGYFRKGKALMGMKKYQEAIKSFEIGLGLDLKNKEMKNALEEATELLKKNYNE